MRELRGFSRPVRVFDVTATDTSGDAVTGDMRTPRANRTVADLGVRALRRFERYRPFSDVWEAMKLDLDDESVVIVPSVTLERVAASGTMTQAYEERFLFLLMLLRQPRCA